MTNIDVRDAERRDCFTGQNCGLLARTHRPVLLLTRKLIALVLQSDDALMELGGRWPRLDDDKLEIVPIRFVKPPPRPRQQAA